MRTKAALLAPAAAALAFALAGCGGSGSASGSATTTTGQGGVLGASGSVSQSRAHVEIGRVNAILSGSLNQLMHAKTPQQASRLATRTSAQLRAEASRIQGLNVPAGARQAQTNLVSSLQSLATDLDTIKGDLQHGNFSAAMKAGTQMSSVIAVRASLKSFQRAITSAKQAGASAGGTATVTTPITTTSASMTTTTG